MYDTIMMDTFLQSRRICAPRVNPKVDYGLWTVMVCRFVDSNECPPLVPDVDNGGVCACGGREYMQNLCTFFSVLL